MQPVKLIKITESIGLTIGTFQFSD